MPALTLLAALAALLTSARALATTEGATRLTIFREPSSSNDGITVIHPQLDVSAALGATFDLTAGYDVDIVSGATPRVYGPRNGVDAVSAATRFSDTRQQVKGGFAYNRPASSLSVGYGYGWESDYRSHTVSATTRTDLLDHNFTLALGYTHNFDSVCDADNAAAAGQPITVHPLDSSAHCFETGAKDRANRRLHIDTVEPSLTWTVSPRLVVQGGGTAQILDGFQANPYRAVLIGRNHNTPQESLPTFRQRYALWGRAAYFFPDLRASAIGMVRVYRDTWAVQAATAEMNLQKYLSNTVLLAARGRYHLQQGARFYRDAAGYLIQGPTGRYWTGDRELSPMSSILTGGRLSYIVRPEQQRSSWFSEIELSTKLEVLFYRLDSVEAPNVDRPRAFIMQVALTIRF